jgi:hypothetical protein
MIQRVRQSMVLMRLDDQVKDGIIIKRVHAKVPTFWIKRRVDVRTVKEPPIVIYKDPESHGMANMFSNTNPTAAFLM